jgi:hypothetical protein
MKVDLSRDKEFAPENVPPLGEPSSPRIATLMPSGIRLLGSAGTDRICASKAGIRSSR